VDQRLVAIMDGKEVKDGFEIFARIKKFKAVQEMASGRAERPVLGFPNLMKNRTLAKSTDM